MKRLVLKQSIKNMLITILFLVAVIVGTFIYMDRIEKINSGEFEIVYQYGGDL